MELFRYLGIKIILVIFHKKNQIVKLCIFKKDNKLSCLETVSFVCKYILSTYIIEDYVTPV
jgi:hypothetical protein